MGLREKIAGWWGKKQSSVGTLLSLMNPGTAIWTPRRYDKFAEEGYQKNVVAFSSIREISRSASSIDWLLYRKQRNGKRIELSDHALLKLLKRPNPLQGGQSFMECVYGFFSIAGNAYIEAVGPSGRPPLEIYTLRPDRMKVVPGRFGVPAAFEYSVGAAAKKWEVDAISGVSPVLHLKTFNPLNDWYGMSPIEAASFAIDIHNKAGEWNKSLLDNGARPSGALVAGGALTDEQFKRLKGEFEEKHTGARNAGRFFLLEGGLDWKEMGLSPKDMEYIESKRTSAREIALSFGVPPMLLGIPGDNTYSNQREARLAFWEQTVLPLANFTRDEFNNWLTPVFGEDLVLDYDEDSISALTPRREKKWEMVKGADFLTINEKREALGYEAIERGDEVYISAALLPLGFGEDAPAAKDLGAKNALKSSSDERARQWAIQMRFTAGYERALKSKTAKLLNNAAKAASNAYESNGVGGVELALAGHEKEITAVLKAHYNELMPASGRRTLEGLKSLVPEIFKRGAGTHGTKDGVEDIFDRAVRDWIEMNAVKAITDITETTRKAIFDVIDEGGREGLPVREIAYRIIERTGGEFSEARANTIARTETHSAAVAANDAAARASGLRLMKEWISARDEKTRPSHLAADGQVRGMDEPFIVGGRAIMEPGERRAGPEETINCRCVLDYIAMEGEP